jgi:hypothetical protein
VQLDKVKPRPLRFLSRRRVVVQLADRRRRIPSFFQTSLHQHFATIERRVVHPVAVRVRIATGEEADSRRHTDRSLHEAVREVRASPCQTIEFRRLDQRVAVRSQTIPAMLVRHDEEDVRPGNARLVGVLWPGDSTRQQNEDESKSNGKRSHSEILTSVQGLRQIPASGLLCSSC